MPNLLLRVLPRIRLPPGARAPTNSNSAPSESDVRETGGSAPGAELAWRSTAADAAVAAGGGGGEAAAAGVLRGARRRQAEGPAHRSGYYPTASGGDNSSAVRRGPTAVK